MRLTVDIKSIRSIDFYNNVGTIDLDVLDSESTTILESMPISDVTDFLSDDIIREEFINRGLTIE